MQKAIEFVCDNLTLRGTAHIPDTHKGKYPFVIMYHGFTGDKTEVHWMFTRLSRELEKLEIGSIRFDFSGSGESDGFFYNTTIASELREALSIYRFALALDYVDADRLFMLGMSVGGLIAGLTAPKAEKLKGLILWAPGGNILEYVINMRKREPADRAGRIDMGGFLLSPDFERCLYDIDIYQTASAFQGNVLIVHGDGDETVPFDIGLRYKKIYGERAELLNIEGANHGFSRPAWKDALMEATKTFLLRELGA
ncbi:MAG: alpha/beta hydrolase [Oscillospiraceae bacterium]|nr:alpha/beta hydrolase [Oscillospiraceae bacterium]